MHHRIESTAHTRTFCHTNTQIYTFLLHANTRAHVHLLHEDALSHTHTHTPKTQISLMGRVDVNHDTETLLPTDTVGMITIYIISDPHPPKPVSVTMATNSNPSPSMAKLKDQWISQLAIPNLPQTAPPPHCLRLYSLIQKPDLPPALWLHKIP